MDIDIPFMIGRTITFNLYSWMHVPKGDPTLACVEGVGLVLNIVRVAYK